MKTFTRVVLVFVLFALLSACLGTDSQRYNGTGDISIYFQGKNTEFSYIHINDTSEGDNIVTDTETVQLTCREGESDVIISFPPEAIIGSRSNSKYSFSLCSGLNYNSPVKNSANVWNAKYTISN